MYYQAITDMAMDGMVAMALPKFDKVQTLDRPLNMIQDSLEKTLNPVFDNPLMSGQLLKNIALTTGNNSINHKLGRKLVGWFVTRVRDVPATLYDTQDSNPLPNLTLDINSSADIVLDIYVF